MTGKNVRFGAEARDRTMRGAFGPTNGVNVTLGPKGRTVLAGGDGSPTSLFHESEQGVGARRPLDLDQRTLLQTTVIQGYASFCERITPWTRIGSSAPRRSSRGG